VRSLRRGKGSPWSRTLVLLVIASAPASAHRLDEYLQAARIGIDPERIRVELDLTPGASVAPRVLAEIDRDGNGVISREEAGAYAARVTGDVRLDVDGRPLALEPVESQCHIPGRMLEGEGTIALQWTAVVPTLASGSHRLTWRNRHHADIGVYLANALVPSSARVAVMSQQRDIDQKELVIEYQLRGAARTHAGWWLASAGAVALLAAAVWRRWSADSPPRDRGTVPRDS
jgi:hypothetical protein